MYICPKFLKMPASKTIDFVKKLKLCMNCLNSGQYADKCNFGKCNICTSKHNSLFRIDTPVTVSSSGVSGSSEFSLGNSLSSVVCSQDQVLLSTILESN